MGNNLIAHSVNEDFGNQIFINSEIIILNIFLLESLFQKLDIYAEIYY